MQLQLCKLNIHVPTQNNAEHRMRKFLGDTLNYIGYWTISIYTIINNIITMSFINVLKLVIAKRFTAR